MTTDPAELRAEPHSAIGATIQRDAGVIIDRWVRRAKAEQPTAKRVHHDILLDHLPVFLWELGRALAEAGDDDPNRHARTAGVHGDQRWETGWSVDEVVRDYQFLRLVLVEYLEEALGRPLRGREVMALGLSIDDAIASSVSAYLACLRERNGPPPAAAGSAGPSAASSAELLGVFGVLGHELRNPLAPLGNALHILRIAAADPARVETARLLMERQLKVMTRLVEDLMDVPRLARGKVSIKAERLDLARLVRECGDDRRGAFAEAGIGLSLEVPDDPVWTTGDATRLTQVVGNLLGNALKFTDRGGEVAVALAADPTRGVATLAVRDTGVGIDPAFLPKVFEAFMQADRSVERSRGGLGLGLALVRGLVELHGGAVRVSSDGPGRGSEFVVELPLFEFARPEGGPDGAAPAADRRPRRVLVIEDNQDSAESTRMLLELHGHQVTVAHSGPDGLKAARTLAPDIVLCDIGLPGMSGYAVCRAFRTDPGLASTYVVALSGHGSDGSQARAAEAGFDQFLLKPVDPEQVARLVAGATPRPGRP